MLQITGNTVYQDSSKTPVQVSLPHILRIDAAIPPGGTNGGGGGVDPDGGGGGVPTPPTTTTTFPFALIWLFNASTNLISANFGNAVGVTITYINVNPTIPFTYSSLLATSEAVPMQVGVTRVQTMSSLQANQPISCTRYPGVGKVGAFNLLPRVYPNQFQPNIVHHVHEYVIDRWTGLFFLQNTVTDPTIYLYFYNNKDMDLSRPFSNNPAIRQYLGPQNGLVLPVFSSGQSLTRLAVRSGELM